MEALDDALGEAGLERVRRLAEAIERRLEELEGVVIELAALKAEYNSRIAETVGPERDRFREALRRIDSTNP